MTTDRVPMTQEQYEKLKLEIERLEREMVEITKRVATAREMGDLSENAEYHAAREDQGTLNIVLQRVNGSNGAVSVQYNVQIPENLSFKDKATPGADFEVASSGIISFAPGQTEKRLAITIKDDRLVEADIEKLLVTISAPQGGAVLGASVTALVEIQDDDMPAVPDAAPNLERLKLAALIFGKSVEHYRDFIRTAYNRFLDRLWAGGMRGFVTCLLYHRVDDPGRHGFLGRGGSPVITPDDLARDFGPGLGS